MFSSNLGAADKYKLAEEKYSVSCVWNNNAFAYQVH